MSHGPPAEWEKEKTENYKRKLGLIMFAAYTTFYLIFVFLCVLSPKLVATKVGGLNLAITYGFALIVVAIIQALAYNLICARKEKSVTRKE
jgi:uncharacterized membrane protein (DUF485 family)